MYNITPIEYLSSIAKEFILTGTSITPDSRYWIEISKINGLTFDIFEGRKFVIYKDGNNHKNGAVNVEYQKRKISGVEKQYLIFPDATFATFKSVTVIAYGTFQIAKDNQAITLMDVYSVKSVVGDIDANGDILNYGKPGLISGIDITKLQNNLKGFYLLNPALQLTNNNVEMCRIKLSRGNINQIRVAAFNQEYSLNLDLRIKYVSDTNFINTLRTETTGEPITVKFSVSIQKYNHGTYTDEWAVLTWKSDGPNRNFQLFVEIPDIANTKPTGTASGSLLNLTWNNDGNTTNGIGIGSVIEIPITQELSYIDNKTIKYAVYVGETNYRHLAIKNNQNLNTLLPGYYYYTPVALDVAKLINIPVGLTDSFTIQCIKTGLTDIRATYILITKWGKLYYGYLENNLINWVTPSLSGHTHHAKNIITDENHRFVTDAWVTLINKGIGDVTDTVKNTLWQPVGYPNKAALPSSSIPGTNVIVLSDETNNGSVMNYMFDGNMWIPSSVNSLKIVTLANGSGLMSSDMLKRLNAVEKQFMMPVGTNWQRLENTQTSHLTGKTNAIDFVYRGSTAANFNTLGTNSIAFGFGAIDVAATKSFVAGFDTASISGEYQVALGEGLQYSGSLKNITLFGKYNQIDDDIVFAYGIGKSDTERKNAFWISKVGDEYFATSVSGFKILNKGGDDIILSDGTTFPKSSIPTEQQIMDKVMAFLEATLADQTTDLLHFTDYSNNTYTTLPIVQQRWKNQIKYMVESWAEFKVKITKLKGALLGQKILFAGYPSASKATEYIFIEGGTFDANRNFTKQNENWCVSTETPEVGSTPPSTTDLSKSFEGNLFISTVDNKIYRYNAGLLNSAGANSWQYFGMDLNFEDSE